MKKAIKITVPEPCHEDWDKMSTTEKGRHCEVCTKEVVDFTKKNDEAIFKYVEKNNNACGRFKPSQLDRAIKLERKERNSFIPWAASFLLPFTMLQPGAANAEVEKSAEKNYTSLGIGRFSTTAERAQIVTKGIVKDHNGVAMHNVKITASEAEDVVWTAKDGSFTFISLDHETLTFQKDGYATQLNKRGSKSERVEVKLISEPMLPLQIMGGIRTVEPILCAEPISEEIVTGDIVEVIEEVEAFDATVTIKGTVTDDIGLPLPGVNIIVKGTTTGAQTDFDGNYSIEAAPGQTLAFSYVGFTDNHVTISNISNTINIVMETGADLQGLMIVTGGYWSSDYPASETEEERNEKRQKQKAADKNTLAFKKIQQERRKSARRARRDKK